MAEAIAEPVELADDLLDELRDIVEQRLSTAAAVCEQHGRDESYHPAFPPGAVVFVHSTEEVSRVVKACAARGVPVP